MKRHLIITTAMIFMIIMICGTVSAAEGNTTKITPQTSNGSINSPSISDDGNWIVYSSDASNIVAGDTPDNYYDVYLFNRQTEITTKITPQSANGNSYNPSISGDGNWIVYRSNASNIVAGDTADTIYDIFLFNRQTGTTTKVTPLTSNRDSWQATISDDGNWITYSSMATNIVAGDHYDGYYDVFLFNRQTGTTTKVTPTASNGDSYTPSISGDGNWITYSSYATNNVAGDTADTIYDIFLFNRQTGTTTKVTPLTSNNNNSNPNISDDGNWITYRSFATNNVAGDTVDNFADIFLFNRQTGVTTKITPQSANGDSNINLDISGDGNWIVYSSMATNIITGDIADNFADIFLFNRQTGVTTKITPQSANGNSYDSSISGDGNWIVYSSMATNIITGDTVDRYLDIFLYDNPSVILSSPSNSNTPAGNEVNAASKTTTTTGTEGTVGMQETGIPIVALILAALMLFGGLIGSKK